MPVVGTLHRDGPLTFSRLHARLGASRDTLAETLRDLAANGLVASGEGTNGRAPYALTPAGERLALRCLPMVRAVAEAGVVKVALKKWPMVVLAGVGRGASRYHELEGCIPGISPRSLALALRDLEAEGLVERQVSRSWPPSTAYTLTPRGEALFPPLDALVSECDDLVARGLP